MQGIVGKVKFFQAEKGYGFITRDDGQGDVFIHINDARRGGVGDVAQNDKLKFDIQETEKGKRAVNIERI